MILQQATFTSTRDSRSDGYHLVSRSRDLATDDVRALVMAGPSHDSLRAGELSAVSFFRLPSGCHAIARTTREGIEHSGRGHRLHTHTLIVSPPEFAKTENNPLVLHELARQCEQFRTTMPTEERAEPVELPWPNTRIELKLLELAAGASEMNLVPTVCDAVTNNERVALIHAARPLHLLAGLFFWLPPELRSEVSFTTGLKYSPRRDFRLMFLDDQAANLRRHARRGIELLDVANPANRATTPPEGWRAVMSLAASG